MTSNDSTQANSKTQNNLKSKQNYKQSLTAIAINNNSQAGGQYYTGMTSKFKTGRTNSIL